MTATALVAPPTTELRRATPEDLDALVALENAGFPQVDRFPRAQLRYFLTKANATVFVIEVEGRPAGSAIVLWRKNAYVGHLYSIVTDPAYRSAGLGRALLNECETAAAKHGCRTLSLEVRPSNTIAHDFYLRHGYEASRRIRHYYPDGESAVRMTKHLEDIAQGVRLTVPYYAQTLDFTCGTACLMMAMKFLNSRATMSRAQELMLWKEATLIFMTSGLGGCGPFGLALAAQARGFQANVLLSDKRVPFLTSVRTDEKKEVIRLVHEQQRREALRLGVKVSYGSFGFKDIRDAIQDDMVPIVLISTARIHNFRAPHWVVVTGFDDANVYFHDPGEGFMEGDKRLAQHRRIPIREFDRMRRYGKDVQKSVVFIGRRRD